MKRLYFDYNATAPLSEGLSERLLGFLNSDHKNPSSVHQDGQKARAVLEQCRARILSLLGAKRQDTLIFTSGGTESNNHVVFSCFNKKYSKNKYLLSSIEHSSVYKLAQHLEKMGAELVWIKPNAQGVVDLDEYARGLTPDVFLASVMLANNETGFLLPVQKMAELARAKGIAFHTDAVCAVGKWPVDFQELGADFLTFSSHKFGGLKGAGGLMCRRETRLEPLLRGGPQEVEKRAGTENLPGIVSAAFALEKSLLGLGSELDRQRGLRKKLKMRIQETYSQARFNESEINLPQTLNVSFVGLDGNLLLTNLDLENVSASYGSACASGSLEVSHVLTNIGLKHEEASSAIRFSFGRNTSEEDIEELAVRMKRVLERQENYT